MFITTLKSTLAVLNYLLLFADVIRSDQGTEPPTDNIIATAIVAPTAPSITIWGPPDYRIVRITSVFDPNVPVTHDAFQAFADKVYSTQARLICTNRAAFDNAETGRVRAYEYIFIHRGKHAIPPMRISPNECYHYNSLR